MKILHILFISLLLIWSAYAEVKYSTVFNGVVPEKGSFTADSQKFYITTLNDTIARVTFPSGSNAVLWVGDCKAQDGYTLCLVSIAEGTFNITAQKYALIPKILIQMPEVKIEISKTVSKISLIKGDTVDVKVIIVNGGSSNVLNAKYTETLPDGVSMISSVDCIKKTNTISWQGDIFIGKSTGCSYKIKLLRSGEYTLTGQLIYSRGNKTVSNKITVIDPPIKIRKAIPKKVELGKELNISIFFINNNSNYNITALTYKIFLPPAIKKLSHVGRLSQISDYYIYQTELRGSSNSSLKLTLLPQESGHKQIKEIIGYKVNGIPFLTEDISNIEISIVPLNIIIDKKAMFKDNDFVRIPLFIQNPNQINSVKNINLKLKTDIQITNNEVFISDIAPLQIKKAIDLEYIVPKEEHNLTILLIYQTSFGETLEKAENLTIDANAEVIPAADYKPTKVPVENNNNRNSSGVGFGSLSPVQIIENATAAMPQYNEKFVTKSMTIPLIAAIIFAAVSFTLLGAWSIKRSRDHTLEEKLKNLK